MLDTGVAKNVERLTAAASAKHLDEALDALWSLAPLSATLAADAPARAKLVPVVYDLGIDLKDAHRLDAAEEVLRTGHRLAHDAGDAGVEASSANHLGILAMEQGRLVAARRWFETALRLRVAAAPALTDAATVYLAGTDANLGKVAADARDLDRAAAHYDAATRRLEEARAAGSHVGALEPFLGNATREAARVAEMRSWTWPSLTAATLAFPASAKGLTSPEVARWAGKRDEALARATGETTAAGGDDSTPSQLQRLQAFALGGFLDAPDERLAWTEEEHGLTLELFDELLIDAPRDLDLRLAKARVLERGVHAAISHGRALAGCRDQMAPDVASVALDLPTRQYRAGMVRMKDAFASAEKVAPDGATVTAELASALEHLSAKPSKAP